LKRIGGEKIGKRDQERRTRGKGGVKSSPVSASVLSLREDCFEDETVHPKAITGDGNAKWGRGSANRISGLWGDCCNSPFWNEGLGGGSNFSEEKEQEGGLKNRRIERGEDTGRN